ncbi:MAG: NUDIX domain-containing protein [Chloroflexota bacterium]
MTKRYKLIPRTLIFITRDDHVLLIKGAPDKPLWANLYNGLGGHVERGEDVLTAARRELCEETGLVIADLWICGVITIDTGKEVGIGVYVLRGETSQGDLRPSKEGTAEWIPCNRVPHLPLVEDLYTLLPRVLKATKSEPPFSAHYYQGQDGQLQIRFYM